VKRFLSRKSVLFHLLMLRQGQDLLFDEKEISPQRAGYNKKKILIVGMRESSHLHRWIEGIADSGIAQKIWLFPSDYPSTRSQEFKMQVSEFPYIGIGRGSNYTFRILDLFFGKYWRSYFLYRLIRRIKPTHIHFHETQHAAYLYSPIEKHPKNRFNGTIILSTWGSDLQVYGKIPSHLSEITKVLSWVDILSAERSDDLQIAEAFQYNGGFLAPVYITVGNKTNVKKIEKVSDRSLVLIKGYQDNHGRALNALASIELLCSRMDLGAFKFRVYSASEPVKLKVELMRIELGLDIDVLPQVPRSEMTLYFREARVYIGLSISDGLSTSMVEAMSAGAFPIQSENSAASEFLIHEVSGGIVNPWNLDQISKILELALTNDEIIENAALINSDTLNRKYNWRDGIARLMEIYN